MAGKRNLYVSDWKPFSELRPIRQDISDFGYKKEFIEKHCQERLFNLTEFWWIGMDGTMNLREPVEVRAEGDEIVWRENEYLPYRNIPKVFETQFGRFNNHFRGEFESWMEMEPHAGISGEKTDSLYPIGERSRRIHGNYRDMFDCGDYSYAVSNQMHMGLGYFSIIRIDKALEIKTVYANERMSGRIGMQRKRLEYVGRYQKGTDWFVIAGGTVDLRHKDSFGREQRDITVIFQIDEHGNCRIIDQFEARVSSANSFAGIGDFVYFGQNRMVTRLNMLSGQMDYFTNKSDEEMEALLNSE